MKVLISKRGGCDLSKYAYYFEMASQSKQQLTKVIKNYTISYCAKEFLGRSLFGEVRLGYQTDHKRVKAFRINSLPLSDQCLANLQLQKYYSKLSQCCTVQTYIQSKSNRYTVMQYFPKTFRTELRIDENCQGLIQKFLHSYATLYYYGIAHGNLSLDNIGITFDGEVKLMDFRTNDKLSFDEIAQKDYSDFKNLILLVLAQQTALPKRFEVFEDKRGNWVKLFTAWQVSIPWRQIYEPKKDPLQNMVVLLSKLQSSISDGELKKEESFSKQKNLCIQSAQTITLLVKVSIRLLMLSYLKKLSQSQSVASIQAEEQANILEKVLVEPIKRVGMHNSILWGCIRDGRQFMIGEGQRLALIVSMLPFLDHEFFFLEIMDSLEDKPSLVFQVYADSLVKNYSDFIRENLIQF